MMKVQEIFNQDKEKALKLVKSLIFAKLDLGLSKKDVEDMVNIGGADFGNKNLEKLLKLKYQGENKQIELISQKCLINLIKATTNAWLLSLCLNIDMPHEVEDAVWVSLAKSLDKEFNNYTDEGIELIFKNIKSEVAVKKLDKIFRMISFKNLLN